MESLPLTILQVLLLKKAYNDKESVIFKSWNNYIIARTFWGKVSLIEANVNFRIFLFDRIRRIFQHSFLFCKESLSFLNLYETLCAIS